MSLPGIFLQKTPILHFFFNPGHGIIACMNAMEKALWDLFEKQKNQGLTSGMRQTLQKLERAGMLGDRYFNAMGELSAIEKNFMVAERYFRQALKIENKPEYRVNLANALFSHHNYTAAREVLEEYLKEYPRDSHALLNLANCLLQLEELSVVKQLCQQALDTEISGRPAFLNCLGQTAFMERRFEDALDYFQRAYLEAPDYVDALFNRANAKYRLGQETEALADYAMCLRKDENYCPALLNKALIHLELAQNTEAKTALKAALRLSPDSADTHYMLGRAFIGETEYRLARDEFRTAMNLEPNHLSSLLGLAKLSLLEAEPDEARALVHRVFSRIDLSQEERHSGLALLFELEDYERCLAIMKEMPEEDLFPAFGLLFTGCLWKVGQKKEALRQLEKHLERAGETPESLTLLGKMLAENGAGELAQRRLRRALELDPRNGPAAYELAALCSNLNRHEEALEVLQDFLANRPGDADCLYNLACLQARRENLDDSLHYLKKALEAGFHDSQRLQSDPDLEKLRQLNSMDLLFSGSENTQTERPS